MVFLLEDENGELIGYYNSNTEITTHYGGKLLTSNSNTFHFNLHSNNNRLSTPMKYELKKVGNGGYTLYNDTLKYISLGDITLKPFGIKYQCYFYKESTRFDYHGIENPFITIKDQSKVRIEFYPKRVLIIQMKE